MSDEPVDIRQGLQADSSADMKIKQAERLLEAHDDPTFAHYGDGQELSQTQREERISMRRRKQAAESRLDDLERSVERLKRAAAER